MFGDCLQIDFVYFTVPNTELPVILSNRKFGYRVADSVFFSLSREVFDFLMKSLIEFYITYTSVLEPL